MTRALGDFQTPPELARQVLQELGATGERWPRVLEPTCGTGTFIQELLRLSSPPREIIGIDIQAAHLSEARSRIEGRRHGRDTRITLAHGDIFHLDLGADLHWAVDGPLLVVGNPPWVTSAEQGALGASNLPPKGNIKGLPGLDALTGSANFDIAESVWLKIIAELREHEPTIALLCKTSVARNVLQYCHDFRIPIGRASIHRIDSKRWFDVSVDACLFTVHPGDDSSDYSARVFTDLGGRGGQGTTVAVRGRSLVADLDRYREVSYADGISPVTWRQGVKHDASGVLELRYGEDGLENKEGEGVDVEGEYCFPLLKSSDLGNGRLIPRHALLLPQKALGEDTGKLAFKAPKLWSYLQRHRDVFKKRRSAVYKGKPEFAIFGIGPYTFAPYKVAISGLYKNVLFHVVGLHHQRPVVLDDTCYFVPCDSPPRASLIWSLLTDPISLRLIHALIFRDAKRPITKRLLQRIDLTAIAAHASRSALEERYQEGLAKLGVAPEGLPEDPLDLLSGSSAGGAVPWEGRSD